MNNKRKKILISLTIIITLILIIGVVLYIKNKEDNNEHDDVIVIAKGKCEIDNKKIVEEGKTYTSTANNENVILIKNGAKLTLNNAIINKKGNSNNINNSKAYGINAGILVEKSSEGIIKKTRISTSGKASSAVFSNNENAKINISNSTINTYGNHSYGLIANNGGNITSDNITISTNGVSSPALVSNKYKSTLNIKNSNITTKGINSPIIYSNGNINISESKGSSVNSQMVVVEGKHAVNIEKTELSSNAIGGRTNIDNVGIMFYQKNKQNITKSTGEFTSTDSSFTINKTSKYYKTAPMFFITNDEAIINLNNSKLSFGSNILIKAQATEIWGTTGLNGGNVTLNAKDQILKGNIEADNLSEIKINLSNSKLTSAINTNKLAKSISITLDAASIWNVTKDSYVTVLNDENETYTNIKSNGHIIYYDTTNNTNLKGNTIILPDGGKLMPI